VSGDDASAKLGGTKYLTTATKERAGECAGNSAGQKTKDMEQGTTSHESRLSCILKKDTGTFRVFRDPRVSQSAKLHLHSISNQPYSIQCSSMTPRTQDIWMTISISVFAVMMGTKTTVVLENRRIVPKSKDELERQGRLVVCGQQELGCNVQ